jgi:PKD repeat protein
VSAFRYKSTVWFWAILLLVGIALSVPTTSATVWNVTTNSSGIQAAINLASAGDTINIGPGLYNEGLTITQSLTLVGAGTNNCVVYYTNTTAVVSITGPGTVTLANFEIEGGQYVPLGNNSYYAGDSSQGIVSSNATLVITNLVINQIRNYFVTALHGSVFATNVALFTRDILDQCDVGFELDGCSTGSIYNLTQDAGQIDHTININGSGTNFTTLTVDHCRIHASQLSWGNCVRTYVNSHVTITNCLFYRNFETPATNYPDGQHNGVGVNGYSNWVLIANNTFSNLPWAVYYYGSPGLGGNQVMVQSNTILNCSVGGILVDGQEYAGLDLGGGPWGSLGNNLFSQTRTDLTSYWDVFMSTNAFSLSTSNVSAVSNCWSTATPDNTIWDQLDNPSLGRVLSNPTFCPTISASFSASLTNGVAPLSVTFADTSTGTITNRFWNFGDGGTTNTASTNVVYQYASAGTNTVSLIVSGPYGVSTNTQSNMVVVVNAPSVTAGNDGPVCAGFTLDLTASTVAGATYSWTGPNGFSSSQQNPTITNATPAASGAYSVTATLDGDTSAPGVTTATVNSASVGGVATPAAATICSGSGTTITLSGQTGVIVNWISSPDNTNWSVIASTANPYSTGNLSTTTYFRAVVQSAECPVSVSTLAQVTVNPTVAPSVTVSANPGTTICAGTSVTFTATPVNGGSGPGYVWKKNNVVVGGNGNSYTDAGLANGDQIDCQLTSNAGCAAPATATAPTVTMTVNPVPTAPTAGNNGPVCAGSTLDLTASTVAGATYSWTGPNGFSSSQQNPTIANASAAASGTYSVTVTVNGCASAAGTTTANVFVDTTPPMIQSCAAAVTNSADATGHATVPDFTAGVHATDNCTAVAQLTITQSPPVGAVVGVGTTPVTLTIKDLAGNSSSCDTTFTVLPLLPPVITAGPWVTNAVEQVANRTVVLAGETNVFAVTATDPSGLPLTYQWQFGDEVTNAVSSLAMAGHVYADCEPYTASVTVSNGYAAVTSNLSVSVACTMLVTNFQAKQNFARPNADSCKFTAWPPLGSCTNWLGTALTLDVGGAEVSWTLDKHGRGVSTNGTCRFTYNKKAGTCTFTASLARGSWRDAWATNGLVNATIPKPGNPVTLRVMLVIGDEVFMVEKPLHYTAAAGKSGTAK